MQNKCWKNPMGKHRVSRRKVLKNAALSLLLLAFFAPFLANAQIKEAADEFVNLNQDKLVEIILAIAQWFLIVVGVIAIIIALWAAFQFVSSVGNEEKIKKARQILIYALVGVVVAILAFSIVTFTKSLFETPAPGGSVDNECVTNADCPNLMECYYGVCVLLD